MIRNMQRDFSTRQRFLKKNALTRRKMKKPLICFENPLLIVYVHQNSLKTGLFGSWGYFFFVRNSLFGKSSPWRLGWTNAGCWSVALCIVSPCCNAMGEIPAIPAAFSELEEGKFFEEVFCRSTGCCCIICVCWQKFFQ